MSLLLLFAGASTAAKRRTVLMPATAAGPAFTKKKYRELIALLQAERDGLLKAQAALRDRRRIQAIEAEISRWKGAIADIGKEAEQRGAELAKRTEDSAAKLLGPQALRAIAAHVDAIEHAVLSRKADHDEEEEAIMLLLMH